MMYPNLMEMFGNLQSVSKDTSDQVAAQSAKVTSLVQQCYQVWLEIMTESMGQTTKAVQDLAACTSPTEAAAVQRAFIETMSAKTLTHVQKMMEMSTAMVGSFAIPLPPAMTKAPAPSAGPAAAAAPTASAPRSGPVG